MSTTPKSLSPLSFDRPASPHSPRKRLPESRDTSLEEMEAMRRLRSRKRFPKTNGHDTLEDQSIPSPRRKAMSPERLPPISDDKRVLDSTAGADKIEFAKGVLLGRRPPQNRAPRANLDNYVRPKPVIAGAKPMSSLPSLSENSPLANSALINTAGSQSTNSKYSYAKTFLLAKRGPGNSKRITGDATRPSKRQPTSVRPIIDDQVRDDVTHILDDSAIPRGMKKAILPQLCGYISDRESELKNKLLELQRQVKELRHELNDARRKDNTISNRSADKIYSKCEASHADEESK